MAWTFYNSSGEAMIIDGGLHDVSEDTTPQLGGNLDMQASLLVGNGGSTGIAISANGEVTMAAQPAFLARNTVQDSNITGNGTTTTIDFNDEVFDQNADFASDTFTAPVTGRYDLSVTIQLLGITTAAAQIQFNLITSNRPYYVRELNTNNLGATAWLNIHVLADMDASDTVTATVVVTGESSDVVDVGGEATNVTTHFSGWLVA